MGNELNYRLQETELELQLRYEVNFPTSIPDFLLEVWFGLQ